MSIILFDGFDLYTTTMSQISRGWSSAPNSYTTGRFGGQAMRLSNQNSIRMGLPGSALSSLTAGFAFRMGTFTTLYTALDLLNGATTECALFALTTGALQFVRGATVDTNVLCQSAGALLTLNTWNFIEVEFVRHATAGSVNLYLNGALVASATGVNTGSLDINRVGMTTQTGVTNIWDWDDFYIATTRLGECRVETLRPSGDSSVQWTPNSGANNFSRVADTTYDGDTSYVSASTAGLQDLYVLGDLVTTPANIFAVQANILARKDDATTRQIATVIKSGSTTQVGATQNLGSSYTNVIDIYEANPDTSAAWTPSDVNGLTVGQKVIS